MNHTTDLGMNERNETKCARKSITRVSSFDQLRGMSSNRDTILVTFLLLFCRSIIPPFSVNSYFSLSELGGFHSIMRVAKENLLCS